MTKKIESSDDTKVLLGLEAQGYRDYTKTLLLLSGGAFIISFLILDRMTSPEFILFLVYTWLFWTIALLMQLGALSMYPKAIREEIASLEADPEKAPKGNALYGMMSRMGLLSTVAFGMGIFFFIVFILYNRNCF
jgi:hypothetical protein